MAKDVEENIREVLSLAVDGASKAFGARQGSKGGGPLTGGRGIAAGVGAVALAPLAVKGVSKMVKGGAVGGLGSVLKTPGRAMEDFTSKLGDSVGSGIGHKVSEKVDQSGGPAGILKEGLKGMLPFGGGDDDDDDDDKSAKGVGKGRRMPVQQSVDVAVPLETAYNQWTQFQLWPNFMHRVTRVTQEDDCTVSFATKIWGKTKEFTAEIETQRPDERIKWRVSDGITHTGVVTFHELGPRLTRVELSLDVEPGGMLEKAARGMRHVKRAARGDLHRFKALIEMQENETGAWRGEIEDGELVQEHDQSYDKKRDYADVDDVFSGTDHDDGDESEDGDDDDTASTSGGGSRRQQRSSSGGRSTSRRSSGGSRSASQGASSTSRRSSARSRSSGSSSSRQRTRSTGRSRNGSHDGD